MSEFFARAVFNDIQTRNLISLGFYILNFTVNIGLYILIAFSGRETHLQIQLCLRLGAGEGGTSSWLPPVETTRTSGTFSSALMLCHPRFAHTITPGAHRHTWGDVPP